MNPMTTRVKICGVTRREDAELAVSCGAWAVGVNFHPESPRRCEPEAASEIATALKRRAEIVGVFVNAPLEEVVRTADAVGLTMLQLHGDEGPAFCEEARRRTGLGVIKVARVRDAASIRALSTYRTEFHMLDAYVPRKPGGTGQRFDWALAAEHRGEPPLILSGGIVSDNVAEAIAAVHPFAIDVASGVEAVPGQKDPDRLRALFRAVAAAAPAPV
jgi:phosphoribosylanthranilate isomerase